jgi:hypothetical protein
MITLTFRKTFLASGPAAATAAGDVTGDRLHYSHPK